MELIWTEDSTVDAYGDWDLRIAGDNYMVGWLRKAVGGEMVWNTSQKTPNRTQVLGHMSVEEAKSVVEAMVRLEG